MNVIQRMYVKYSVYVIYWNKSLRVITIIKINHLFAFLNNCVRKSVKFSIKKSVKTCTFKLKTNENKNIFSIDAFSKKVSKLQRVSQEYYKKILILKCILTIL